MSEHKTGLFTRVFKASRDAFNAFRNTVNGGKAPQGVQTSDPTAYIISSLLRQFGEQGQPGPVGAQRDNEWYAISADVRAAVDLLSENASDVKFSVTVNDERNDDHPLAVLLRNPNPDLGGRYFWRRVWSLFYLTGETFIVGERTDRAQALSQARVPFNELWPVPGNWVKAIANDEYIGGWQLAPPNNQSLAFNVPREDVCELTTYNPDDPIRGLSPLRALRMSLEMRWSAEKANLGIFKNGMMTQGAWVMPAGIDEEAKRQIRESLTDGFAGAMNAHKTPILPLDMKYEQVGFSPEDVQYLDLMAHTTRDVAKVFRIPSQLLGDTERSTYNNMTEAKIQLWNEGILPVVSDMVDQLNARFAWQWGDGVRIIADTSGIKALRTDAQEEANAVQTWVISGFDPKWAYKHVTGEDAPDEAVAPPTQQTEQQASADPAAPAVSLQPEEKRATDKGGPDCPSSLVKSSLSLPPRKVIAARQFQDIEELCTACAYQVRQAFDKQLEAVLAALEAVYSSKALRRVLLKDTGYLPGMQPGGIYGAAEAVGSHAVIPAELMPVIFSESTQQMMEEPVISMTRGAARKALNTYRSLVDVNIEIGRNSQGSIEHAQEVAGDRVVDINDTTRQLIHDGVVKGLEEGDGFTSVRDAVIDAFKGTDPEGLETYHNRDENIARTEMGRAYNTAARDAIADCGLNLEWMCSPKPTSRDTHLHLNGHVIPPDGMFKVGEYWAPNPHHELLGPDEACNCGCTVIGTRSPVSPGEENNHRNAKATEPESHETKIQDKPIVEFSSDDNGGKFAEIDV